MGSGNRPGRINAAETFVDANVAAGGGDRVAIIDVGRGGGTTYSQLQIGVNRAGNALRSLGIRIEDRVMLLLHDRVEFAQSFFGAIKIGAVPVPVNTRLGASDYAYLLEDSRARALIVSAELLPVVAPILDALRYLDHVLVVGGDGSAGRIAFDTACQAASGELDAELMSPDDACFWLYSSGTTGFPKGAVHLQHDMAYCADNYAIDVLGLTPADSTFSVAKLFFAYGLGNALYFPLRVGATAILDERKPTPATVLEVLKQQRSTVFFAVPTFYAALLAQAEEDPQVSLDGVRLCVSAGEALSPSIFERWRDRFGLEILDGIGSTEILHIFISNRPGRARSGSSGELVPGYEARVVGEDGREVDNGVTGDLLIRGDSTCACYWNKHAQTKATILGDWIRTGDKYQRDDQGYFLYQGRSDDMMKVGGMWVSPVEVENCLASHPAVLESAVVGVADEDGLIKTRAHVVLKRDHEPSPELAKALKEFVKANLEPFKYPRTIVFTTELPKTATGKIQRFELRETG